MYSGRASARRFGRTFRSKHAIERCGIFGPDPLVATHVGFKQLSENGQRPALL